LGKSVALTDEEDQIIWSFNSNGRYFVQSLYAVINHRGVVPVFVQAIWKLSIPPRVQIFLWLLAQNRSVMRDNLAKRREVNDPTCLLCSENESIVHLFFDCCVATNVWHYISDLLNVNLGKDFESVASLWLANKKHLITNIVSSAILWVIWKLWNSLCF
jgi:hypothetical protein